MDDISLKTFENFGAMAILGIIVWRLPNMIASVNEGIKMVISNIKEVQTETLNSFEAQMTKDREMYLSRFERMETVQGKLLDVQGKLVEGLGILLNRKEN